MLISNSERKLKNLLRLDLQFFGEEGGAAGGAEGGTDAGTAATNAAATAANAAAGEQGAQANEDDRIAKLVQSQVDRLMAEERKKSADLQKQIAKMQREKMSDEEIKKLEFEEKEKNLADRERKIAQQTNLIYAQQAVTKAGYGDDLAAVVDFVMGDSEEKTDERIKAFSALVNKITAAQVDKTFKQNGRTPNGASAAHETKTENTIAEKLGKTRAEQTQKANDILNHYIGGKK